MEHERKRGQVLPLDDSRRELVERYLPFAHKLARAAFGRWGWNRRIESADLRRVAELALVDATSRFDDSRGVKFSTFVSFRIVGALKDFASGQAREARLPGLRRRRGVGLADEVARSRADIERVAMLDELHRAIDLLPAAHGRVVRLCMLEGRTQLHVAAELGYSQSRISALRRESLELLRDLIAA